MKVEELRLALEQLDLSTKGNKTKLKERLKKAKKEFKEVKEEEEEPKIK